MDIKSGINCKVETKVIFQVYRGGKLQNEVVTKNLTLDTYTSITGTFNGRMWVGTGTSVPAKSNTKLDNAIGTFAQNTVSLSATPETLTGLNRACTKTLTFSYALGAIVGNITEFGLGTSNSIATQSLFTRGLITNLEGNPTAITVTAEDQLVVTYIIRKVYTAKTIPFSFVSGGTTYTGKIHVGCRPTVLNTVGGKLNPISPYAHSPAITITIDPLTLNYTNTTAPSANTGLVSSDTYTYTVSSMKTTYKISATLAQGNLTGGIKYITSAQNLAGTMDFIIEFDTPLSKDSSKILNFDFVVTETLL